MNHRFFVNLSLACFSTCVLACKRDSVRHGAKIESDQATAGEKRIDRTELKRRAYDIEDLADVVLFPPSDPPKAGLEVEILDPVVWASDTEATFTYRICNFLDDEVFVQVQELHTVGANYEGPGGSHFGGIGSGIEMPDNRILLKRLHGGGLWSSCAEVKAATFVPEYASDKGRTTVQIPVTGFYRADGKQFVEWIELPFPLKKDIPIKPNKTRHSNRH